MRIGYARVSTADQSLTVQLEALRQSGCAKIFQEVASGAQADRQALTAALDYVRPDDTTTAIGQFFFQITGAFAELERNLIRERTMAGLAIARRRGRCSGRPKSIDPNTFAMALQLYEARTISVQSICAHLGIARRTFYRYLAAYRVQHLPRS